MVQSVHVAHDKWGLLPQFYSAYNSQWVVSGLPGARYSICCLGFSTIMEFEKIVTMWHTTDLKALTRKDSRGVGHSPHYLPRETLRFSLKS